ncbi:hypothetical protein ACF0H5_012806 [Mactra antiquata]
MSASSSFTVSSGFHGNELNETIVNENIEDMSGQDFSLDSIPFSEDEGFTDVILEVEGVKLHTSRSLLAFASPVFCCMFTSDFREKTANTIKLPDKKYATIRDMLSFLHPGVDFRLTRDNVFPLLLLAEEYQISVLKTACEGFLLEQWRDHTHPTADFIVRCLEYAEKCDMRNLMSCCKDSMSDPDIPLRLLKENSQISLELKSEIFELRIGKLESEKAEMGSVRNKLDSVKRRLRDIVLPHDEHCRCRVEVKLRNPVQRVCPYCTRNWCTENINTEAYRNSYKFYCNHKIGYHIIHDATIRTFLDQD